MNFDVLSDRALIRAEGGSRRYALVSFTAPSAPPKEGRTPINVSFVLDRSGSMGGERKIELVQEAVDKAVGMLREDDMFSVVIYDNEIEVLMEPTPASGEAKRAVRRKLGWITARGSTNLGGGWLCGCEQVAKKLKGSVPAKCLLLTDGLANEGITNRDELTKHAGELRQRGVMTSTFGVGSDFDEVLLQKMADAGGGHSYYVERAVQIPDFLTSELGETLEIVAGDVKLAFTLPADVTARPLNPFRFEHSAGSLVVDLGSLVSGQEITVVVELRFPAGDVGAALTARVGLSDQEGVLEAGPAELSWTFADHAANDKQLRDRSVDAAVAGLYAAKARDEALEFNRKGDFAAALDAIKTTASRIHAYAGDDKSLHGIADALVGEATEFNAPMNAREMKARYYQSHHSMRNRDIMGKTRRKGN